MLPYSVFNKFASVFISLSDAIGRIMLVGRTSTGAFAFVDFSSRLEAFTRAVGQTLSANVMASRTAAFYRNIITALSVLFGWLFRFPAWFYSSQPACEAAGYNWCSGSCSAYACGVHHDIAYANIVANQQIQVNETGTNVSLLLLSNTTLNNIAFETWSYEDTPVATTLADDTDMHSLMYFNVTANSTLNATTLKWVMIMMNYTDSELSANNLVESTLSVYMYNVTLGRWIQITNSSAGIFATGVNTGENYGWVNKTNMSLYALGGLYVNGHACSASAECYSSACCSGTCQASCAAPTSPPVSPGGGGGAAAGVTPITPPAEAEVKYKKIAVLREVVPGQTVVVGVEVKNEGTAAQKDMVLAVSGVPESWIYTSVSSVSMQSSETKGFNIVVTPPAGAESGDYKVTLKLKNANVEAENFFVVRVRHVPADYDKPIVSRQVDIDMENGKTNVDIVVSNPYREFERIDVVESIPKELANSTEYVDFVTKPNEVVRKDPIVMWSITGMAVGDTRTISYSVQKVLDEFTPYIYWPLRQLNIISPVAPSSLKLTGFTLPYFTAGTSSAISFKVKNMDTAQHNFTLEMELPVGWKMEPEMIKETIGPGEEKEFKMIVTPAADATAGRYMARTAFGWDGTYVVREYVAEVSAFEAPWLIIGMAVSILAVGVYYYYHTAGRGRAVARDEYVLNKKLRSMKDAIAGARPMTPERARMESELLAVKKLKADIESAIVRARSPAMAEDALERLKSIIKRKNKP
jgi:hypothetical protein